MNYLYLVATVFFTVYAQVTIKWQVGNAGDFPVSTIEKLFFIARLLLNPWVISAFIGAFIGAITWMLALTKFELSHAYPFMGLTFAIILILSSIFFQESISSYKIIGVCLMILGIIMGSKG